MKPDIMFVGRLTKYRDNYTDAQLYRYISGSADFYFDANFANEERVDNRNIYDVVVTKIGKAKPDRFDLMYDLAADIDRVKAEISRFFQEHGLFPSDEPARHVYFE